MRLPTLTAALVFVPLFAQAPVELLEQKTLARIQTLDAKLGGTLGVYAIDLSSGRTIAYHAQHVFPTASSIKIAILIQMFRAAEAGRLQMTDVVTVQPSETVGGSGHLQELLRKGPVTLTVRDLIAAMIQSSDNTATNKCIALVGLDNVNAMLMQAGLKETKLQRIMIDTAAAKADRENISTPQEMARLAEMLYREKFPHSKEMLGIMKLVNADFRKTIPASVEVAAKPGSLPGALCETGIVFLGKRPFALSVMSTFLGNDENPVPEAIRIVYEHFEKLNNSNSYGNKLQ